MLRETKDRVSLQDFFTGSLKVTFCGFWQKRVRLSDLLEGGLTALQEPILIVLLVLLLIPDSFARKWHVIVLVALLW